VRFVRSLARAGLLFFERLRLDNLLYREGGCGRRASAGLRTKL